MGGVLSSAPKIRKARIVGPFHFCGHQLVTKRSRHRPTTRTRGGSLSLGLCLPSVVFAVVIPGNPLKEAPCSADGRFCRHDPVLRKNQPIDPVAAHTLLRRKSSGPHLPCCFIRSSSNREIQEMTNQVRHLRSRILKELLNRVPVARHSHPSVSGFHPSDTRCIRSSWFQILAIGSLRSSAVRFSFIRSLDPSSIIHVTTLRPSRAPGRRSLLGTPGDSQCQTTTPKPRLTAATSG